MVSSLREVDGKSAPRLRRVRRPLIALLSAVAVLALILGAFLAGRLTAPPIRASIEEAQKPISVFSSVEMRPVDSRVSFPANVKAGDVVNVQIPSANGAVVVRQGVEAGGTISSGSLVAVLSGVPYFALPGPLPLYRTLTSGDTGDDVRYLQVSLNSAGLDSGTSGKIDSRTQRAVAALFKRSGFQLSCCGIPYQQLVPIATLPTEVVASAVVGSTPSDTNPVVQVRGGPAYIAFTADAVAATTLKVGDQLTANVGGKSVVAQIESIGEFVAPTGNSTGGREVRLRPADNAPLSVGIPVTVFGPGENKSALAIPLVSVREDNDGPYVLRRVAANSQSKVERVRIQVIRSGGGWAAIADGGLKAGDKVLVS